jgi:hypothetical protein
MNPAKCDELDYIDFLVASQRNFSCTEASRCQPQIKNKEKQNSVAHDAFNRLLLRLPQNTEALWEESKQLINKQAGFLIVDDSTLDKPYSEKIDLVTYHWSGKHHKVVRGINLITLLWSDGQAHIPVDFRIYNKKDGKTKNDHFQELLKTACNRGFKPKYVLFDSWYSSFENLKLLRSFGYNFFCGLKENRLVNPTQGREGEVNLCTVEVSDFGLVVYLKGFGLIKVFRKVSKNGDISFYGCNVLHVGEGWDVLAGLGWRIEEYHRGIKQCCGVERAFVRKTVAVANHVGMAIRAFLRFEIFRLKTGKSWYEAKTTIIRHALQAYLAHPNYTLTPTA